MFINGKEMNFNEGITITEILKNLNLSPEKVVVEVNMEIIAKEKYSHKKLNTSDKLEIVSFVGGG